MMNSTYDQLLLELGISAGANSFEICRQLKNKKNELKAHMTSRQSEEENEKLEKEIRAINEAEVYFEKIASEEKKADKPDGFDYNSLKNKGRKVKKSRQALSEETTDVSDMQLSFEERYDNIIGLMGTPDGFEDGFEQLKQLANGGYIPAQNRIGQMYYYGEKSIATDYKEAEYWYEKTAEAGYTAAYNMLGLIYMEDNGVGPNREKAIYWLKKAAEQQVVVAYWNLGLVYVERFEEKDYREAAYWYEKAAEGGYVDAYNELGRVYMDNNGVGPNREKAIYWLKKAAEQQVVYAYWNLGLVYEDRFEEKDYKEAAYWYEKAAEAGYVDAYNRVGYVYMNVNGGVQNREKAIYWLKKAAEQQVVAAYWNLGLVYENRFEEKDYKEATYWYEKAAMEGYTAAYNKLGCLYISDNGVGPNREKAIYWLEKAAEQQSVEACWNLGLVYEDRFEQKDYEKAAYWYEKAAEGGDTDAYTEAQKCREHLAKNGRTI